MVGELVEQLVVVGKLVERLELERFELEWLIVVEQLMERLVVVRQLVERLQLERLELERQQLVGWVMARGELGLTPKGGDR